jgi:hypothetical protein
VGQRGGGSRPTPAVAASIADEVALYLAGYELGDGPLDAG